MRLDGVALGFALALLLGAVERLVVGQRMAVGADDVRVHEGGPLARAAVLGRVAQRVVGLEEIAAVHLARGRGRESRARASRSSRPGC